MQLNFSVSFGRDSQVMAAAFIPTNPVASLRADSHKGGLHSRKVITQIGSAAAVHHTKLLVCFL